MSERATERPRLSARESERERHAHSDRGRESSRERTGSSDLSSPRSQSELRGQTGWMFRPRQRKEPQIRIFTFRFQA